MNDTPTSGASNAVYVQTNTTPNEVIAFRRSDDGLSGRAEHGGTESGVVAAERDGIARVSDQALAATPTRRRSGLVPTVRWWWSASSSPARTR